MLFDLSLVYKIILIPLKYYEHITQRLLLTLRLMVSHSSNDYNGKLGF